ncbi:MAG TPA: hypothetical protein VE889_06350 [Actinomycetota bacterium]|nr:hypothetical protein [Actinomycetota bacterium]
MKIHSSLEIAPSRSHYAAYKVAITQDFRLCFHGHMTEPDGVEMVVAYLRGQNLEQVGRVDEAIALYESAVVSGFDSTGPYDRLISLYAERAQHRDVVRVAEAAIANVHTHADKRAWFERMRAEALKALAKVPKATPKRTDE